MQKLAADRPNRGRLGDAREAHLTGPTAGGEHDPIGA
jgi:hypothetical protein